MARHVLDVINEISSTNATTKKQALLQANDHPVLRKVLEYAYNPYKVYKIKQLPNEVELMDMGPSQGTYTGFGWELLDELAAAKGVPDSMKRQVMYHLRSLPAKERVVFCRILKKDLRAGIDYKTINKVFPDLIPDYLCGLADKFNPKKAVWPAQAEEKMDGFRCQAYVSRSTEEVYFSTRNGLEIGGYHHIRQELLAIAPEHDFVFDGELMAPRFGNKAEKESQTAYVLYDGMTRAEWDARQSQHAQLRRRAEVNGLLQGAGARFLRMVGGKVVHSLAEFEAFYLDVLEKGGEGLMYKDPHAKYPFGRSKCWQKYKPFEDCDVEIVGVEEGEAGKKYEGKLGAIVVDFNGVHVRVGSGFSDEDRDKFWKVRERLIGRTAEIRYTPFSKEQPLTPEGKFLFGRFKKLRTDK